MKGFTQGLFTWLLRAPWGNPGFSALFLSVVLFGLLGGVSGVTMGSYDMNLKWHNTLAVVGHFKGTVVVGTSLAFMGLTYYLLPLLFRRKVVLPRLAAWQPWLFGLGMALLSLAMMRLGVVYRHSAPLSLGLRILGWKPHPTYRCTTWATWAWWPASWIR
jgi:cytochrome c oxidase subunit 1